jgi:NAD(P)-dependent dehydrogenase (short-subunit alcohol dehydrogenase family)
MSERLSGKVAVVTGIGSGIGRGCALRFASEGAFVIGTDINGLAAERTVQDARDQGFVVSSIHPLDLTVPLDVAHFLAEATHGRDSIDVLVNAGAIEPRMATTELMDFETEWRPTIAGELDLVFLACQAAWPYLKASGSSSIINFASVNSFRGSRHLGMVAHTAGKGAVLSMTRQLAIEGGPFGIRANTIAPGLVQTGATAAAGATTGPVAEALSARTLLGRLGVPDDIAWCATYLASDEAKWVTGANFTIDGGVTAA